MELRNQSPGEYFARLTTKAYRPESIKHMPIGVLNLALAPVPSVIPNWFAKPASVDVVDDDILT